MYKLLVIDDEPLVRRGIVSLIPFEELGVEEIFEASNGQIGLDLVKEKDIDIVLCDINMPKLNGLEFSKEVKGVKPWVKIAIITGYDYFDYAKQALKIGVEDYVLKPVSKQDVYQVVANLIKKIETEKTMKEVYKTIHATKQLDDGNMETAGYKEQIDIFIAENISNEDLSLTLLAEHLGLSDSYLSSLFKKYFGIPFSDYILHQRIEKSKLLLLSTSLKNYEIAEQIGITDANYFSTLFRKHVGDSPNKFKKKIQRNN